MRANLQWEPIPESGNSYDAYVEVLSLLGNHDYWDLLEADPRFVEETEHLVAQLQPLEDLPLRFPAVTPPETAIAFKRAVTVLAYRSDFLAAQKRQIDAIKSIVSALRLSKKLFKGRGPAGLYMYSTAAEVVALAAARRRLFSHLYRGMCAEIFNEFPDVSENSQDVAYSFRTEYQWIIATKDMPLKDLLSDPLQIDWWGVASSTPGLAPWPDFVDRSMLDESATENGFAEMISAEIDWYVGRIPQRPNLSHLWADLPPRAAKNDARAIDRFESAVKTISNPVGKACLRNASIAYEFIWRVSKTRVNRVRKARFWTQLLSMGRL